MSCELILEMQDIDQKIDGRLLNSEALNAPSANVRFSRSKMCRIVSSL